MHNDSERSRMEMLLALAERGATAGRREARAITHAEAYARLKAKGVPEVRLRGLFPSAYDTAARVVQYVDIQGVGW